MVDERPSGSGRLAVRTGDGWTCLDIADEAGEAWLSSEPGR